MADQEEDFSSLPLSDRFVHKAYEDAIKQFEATPDESDPTFRPFLQDPGLWKGAVTDSNVAAQQEGVAALCAFLKFGGREACLRSRGHTISGIAEKCLPSTRAATKASSIEALLLYIELDVAGPVVEDLLPTLSSKQPKVIAATLAALTSIYHNYGCKIVDPKPVLKVLPKVFGHADKNVRAEATKLAVEFYRWLREAMKPMFWGDLKPTQQTELEAHFEEIKNANTAPKQERLLRTQQEQQARLAASGGGDGDDGEGGGPGGSGGGDDDEEPIEVDVFDLAEPQDVLRGMPADFYEKLASSKWKDRKEAVDALFAVLNVPRIKDGDFNEMNRGLAKCMKDANVAVVTQAAQCIEALAKGLRKSYGKYRTTVMQPIMERLKEKKQSVADALGAALDQIFLATSLSDCLEDISTFLGHKNPQVKEGTMRFLVRCLRTTRDVPSKPEIATIVEGAKKLLSESVETLRSGGAEVLGTVMKIIGERAMNPHLEGLDDIRKAKIKEFFESAEVRAKEKPKAAPPPPRTVTSGGGPAKKMMGGAKKGGPASSPLKKATSSAAAARPTPHDEPPLAPQPTSRAGPGSKLGMPKTSALGGGGMKAPQKRTLGGPAGAMSPRRLAAPQHSSVGQDDDDQMPTSPPPPAASRMGMPRGGLASRSLVKPSSAAAATTAASPPPASPTPMSGLTALERAELEELRASNERLLRQAEEFRHERAKLTSEIQELKNQNAGLIEDHTRDVLSIKAKETQLVRARSDTEAAEQTNERLRRELDRLKRALGKAEAVAAYSSSGERGMAAHAGSERGGGYGNGYHNGSASPGPGYASPTNEDAGIYRDGGAFNTAGGHRGSRMSFASTMSEEKENGEGGGVMGGGPTGAGAASMYARNKLSPDLRYAATGGGGSGGGSGSASSGRGSPARGLRRDMSDDMGGGAGGGAGGGGYGSNNNNNSSSGSGVSMGGQESWKRAAEVTNQLKARIEQMKAKQGLRRG